MACLLDRLQKHGNERESFSGLVQVFRFCGLLDESVAAHQRSRALDPAYLDAAAWTALGDCRRAMALLRDRVSGPSLSPLMSGLMGSLLAILDGRRQDAAEQMANTEIRREPE